MSPLIAVAEKSSSEFIFSASISPLVEFIDIFSAFNTLICMSPLVVLIKTSCIL